MVTGLDQFGRSRKAMQHAINSPWAPRFASATAVAQPIPLHVQNPIQVRPGEGEMDLLQHAYLPSFGKTHLVAPVTIAVRPDTSPPM
jgi:hypothetical protein